MMKILILATILSFRFVLGDYPNKVQIDCKNLSPDEANSILATIGDNTKYERFRSLQIDEKKTHYVVNFRLETTLNNKLMKYVGPGILLLNQETSAVTETHYICLYLSLPYSVIKNNPQPDQQITSLKQTMTCFNPGLKKAEPFNLKFLQAGKEPTFSLVGLWPAWLSPNDDYRNSFGENRKPDLIKAWSQTPALRNEEFPVRHVFDKKGMPAYAIFSGCDYNGDRTFGTDEEKQMIKGLDGANKKICLIGVTLKWNGNTQDFYTEENSESIIGII